MNSYLHDATDLRTALGGLDQAAGAVMAGYAFGVQSPSWGLTLMIIGLTFAAAWLVRQRPQQQPYVPIPASQRNI